MTSLNVDLWLPKGDTSGKRGRESGLCTGKHEKLFRIVRAGLDVNFRVDPRDGTGNVEKNHHVLKVFVVFCHVAQLKRTCLCVLRNDIEK